MPYISRASRRRIWLFISVLALTVCLHLVTLGMSPIRDISTVLYGALLIAWVQSVRSRIIQTSIRRFLMAGAGFLLTLFVLRFCRWEVFAQMPAADRLLWAAYYVPFTAVPLLSLCAALCVGQAERAQPLGFVKWLWGVWVLLCAGILTNGLHHTVFLPVAGDDGRVVRYGWLYAVIVAWCATLTVSAFLISLRRCRLSQCRRLWYVPVLAILLGFSLLLAYFVAGGSPTLWGRKLYNLHEAFAFSFILLWESCIQIGLIPANTDYGALFHLSHLSAALLDREGVLVDRAEAFVPACGETLVQKEQAISGGRILWTEDVSAIRALNGDIREATELLEAENELIEHENRIQAEQARYAEQNRLYDKIAITVRPQLAAIAGELGAPATEETAFRRQLTYSTVLGAYIKRRANLELLADRQRTLSTAELAYAIGESFEYLTISGCTCELQADAPAEIPAPLMLLAYDLFQAAVEAAYSRFHSISVEITPAFSMRLALDDEALALDRDWQRSVPDAPNAMLTVSAEDGVTHIHLAGQGVGR